jgi:signal transduction histidine kinase
MVRTAKSAPYLGNVGGEVVWRVTSARRWWIEYDALLNISFQAGEFPPQFELEKRFQFFSQNIDDALSLEGDVIEIAQEALDSLRDTSNHAERLHQMILDGQTITRAELNESSDISAEIVSLAADLGTFKYVYYGPEGKLEPFKRNLMVRSIIMLAGVFLLAISAAVIHRQGVMREQEAKHSKLEALGALAAGYSHAISSIVGGLQIIIDTVRASLVSETQQRAFDQLDIGMQRLRVLNTNLSMIARGNPVDDSLAPLKETIGHLLELPDHPNAPLRVVAKICNSARDIPVPNLAIGMIGMEMISNARNHTSQATEPTIWITAELTDRGWLRITFEDNGHGISARNVPKVLDPFFSTTGEGHAGLGLTSVKSMVESMGGRIEVMNRASASGAVFVLDLPVHEGRVPVPPPHKR